ncbi:hypothetical protein ABEY96_22255 [Priestia aryabhattai]|uniref:hypothetical protein n=1 Tax=Priestia aryabhattai TaxID=412384 RepID=UPI003D29ED6B
MSIILVFIIFIGFFILGIRLWNTRRGMSLVLLTPAFLMLLSIGYGVFNSWYHTEPNLLKFSVQKENQVYTVKGVWEKPLDAYRFPTDFIIFYVPNNAEITYVKRNRVKDYKNMDQKFLEESIKEWINKDKPPKSSPKIFDIETSKRFSFSFILPDNVKADDVKIYYAHTRAEPMDALEFWFKKIELN